MKSINKLILFFMLIFIGASVTANAFDNEGQNFVQSYWIENPALNYNIVPGMYIYTKLSKRKFVYPSWMVRLNNLYDTGMFNGQMVFYWYNISSPKVKRVKFITITRDDNQPCNLAWYDLESILPIRMSAGVVFYITIYDEGVLPNLPPANYDETLERVGERHRICAYQKHPNFFRFFFTFHPSANLLEIGVQNANEKHNTTNYINNEFKMYVNMDSKA